MKCKKCGNEIAEGMTFCSNCGENNGPVTGQQEFNSVPTPVQTANVPQNKKKGNKVLIIVIIILGILLLVIGGLFACSLLGVFDKNNTETKEEYNTKNKDKDKDIEDEKDTDIDIDKEDEKDNEKDDDKKDDDKKNDKEKDDKKDNEKDDDKDENKVPVVSTENVTTCSISGGDVNIGEGMDISFKVYDKDNTVYKLDVIFTFTAASLDLDSFDQLTASEKTKIKDEILSSLGYGQTEKGLKTDVEFKGSTMLVTVSVDFTLADDEALAALDLDLGNNDLNANALIKELENEGMTCR